MICSERTSFCRKSPSKINATRLIKKFLSAQSADFSPDNLEGQMNVISIFCWIWYGHLSGLINVTEVFHKNLELIKKDLTICLNVDKDCQHQDTRQDHHLRLLLKMSRMNEWTSYWIILVSVTHSPLPNKRRGSYFVSEWLG